MPSSHLIVGLGNPGPEYQATRHNIGFMVVERIAARYQCPAWKKKFKGQITAPPAIEHAFTLLMPQTYMNLSGESVGEAMRYLQLAPENIIVFHDDIDLLASDVRIKQGGGTGGHNGLKSIDAHIGKDYWRVRLGVGHPGEKGAAVTNHVLGSFAKADKIWLDQLLDNLANEFSLLLQGHAVDYAARVAAKNKGV
jgi:PTH1 family peptidyl-tRNA hydrolase